MRVFVLVLLVAFVAGETSRAIADGFNSDPYWGVAAEYTSGPSLDVFSTQDGLTWNTVKSVAYISAGEDLRDPSMLVIGNVMWCAHTSGTSFGQCDYFSLIKSTDFGRTWTFVQHIYTKTGGTQSWGPRLYRDRDGSIHIIIAVSTNNLGSLGCYELHPLGSDLGGSWSSPVAVAINGAASVSNEFYPLYAQGKYWLFYTSHFNSSYYATGTSLTGPYTQGGQIVTSGSSFYVENPSVVPLANGYGMTAQDGGQKFLTSTDLIHWSAESTITLGSGIVHPYCSQTYVMNDANLAITTQPAGNTVTKGGNAMFTAAANDPPPTGYQWQRLPAGSGTWQNLSDISGTYAGTAMTTLTLGNVATAMNGDQFRCVAGNGYLPGAISNAATLTVLPPPVITTLAGTQTVTPGQSVTFSVSASGSGPFTYQWYKGGIVISGATDSSYTISNSTTDSSGNYTVTVTDAYGGSNMSDAYTLTVNEGVPALPPWELSMLALAVFFVAGRHIVVTPG